MARDAEEAMDQDDVPEEDLDDGGGGGGRSGVGFVVGLVLGALVGAGTALLLAPERGEVTRRRIGRRVRRFRQGAAERMEDVRDSAERELRRAKRRVRRHLPD